MHLGVNRFSVFALRGENPTLRFWAAASSTLPLHFGGTPFSNARITPGTRRWVSWAASYRKLLTRRRWVRAPLPNIGATNASTFQCARMERTYGQRPQPLMALGASRCGIEQQVRDYRRVRNRRAFANMNASMLGANDFWNRCHGCQVRLSRRTNRVPGRYFHFAFVMTQTIYHTKISR